ncbi:MAG: HEAT repeat domain-containing protein [Planctomycetota bacterium]|nr:HEAT repeat domain-containing protein [Planctomycetota bacterium]
MFGQLFCFLLVSLIPATHTQELELEGPDLIGMSIEEMSEKLLAAAANPHPERSEFLLEGLKALMEPQEEAGADLLPGSLTPRSSGDVFHRVLKTLTFVADESLLEELEELADSEIQPLRFAAISLIGIIGGDRAGEVLLPLLKSKDHQLRTAAILALSDTASMQAAKALKGMRNDTDRIAVRFALERLSRHTGRSEIPHRGQKKGRLYFSGLQKKPDLRGWQIEAAELDEGKLDEQIPAAGLIVLKLAQGDETSPALAEKLDGFVRGGGALLIQGQKDSSAPICRALGISAPKNWQEKKYRCTHWLPDFHPVVSSVYELDDVYPDFSVSGGWRTWSQEQRAPLRSPDGKGAGPLIYQTLGKGMVLLSAIDLLGDRFFRANLLNAVYGPEFRAAKSFVWALNESWETPHRKWGKPLDGGPLRVLFVMPRLHKRGVVEMAQRIELEYAFLPLLTQKTKGARKGAETKSEFTLSGEVAAELETHLGRPWDVLVVGQTFMQGTGYYQRFGWREFPGRLKRLVAVKIRDGRGLVFVPGSIAGSAPELAGSRAVESDLMKFHFPFFSSKAVNLKTLSEGRIACFNQSLPYSTLWESYKRVAPSAFQVRGIEMPKVVVPVEESGYAALAKTLLWASGREDKGRIASIDGDDRECRLVLNSAAVGLSAEVRIRDRYNHLVHQSRTPVKGNRCGIPLPALPAGAFVLEAVLEDPDERSTDWAAMSFEILREDRIQSVEADHKSYAAGETAKVKLGLSILRAKTLLWRVEDTWGRLTHSGELRAGELKAPRPLELRILFLHPLSRLHYLWIDLRDEDGLSLAVKRQPLLVRMAQESDFRWYQAGGGSKGFVEQLAAAGVDCIGLPVTASVIVDRALENNIGFWSAWSGIGAGYPRRGNADGTGHSVCPSGPAFRTMLRRNFEQKCPRALQFGINVFMLEDESSAGVGQCDHLPCVTALQEYLRGQYGSLEALNASWKTSFKRWDEVRRQPAKDPQTLAPAIDPAHFMRRLYAEWIDESQGGIRRFIPDARVGFSVSWGDAWELSRFLSATMWHRRVFHYDYHISYGRPETVFGTWYGPTYNKSDRNEAQAKHDAWAPLFGGASAFFEWWGARHFGYNFVRPDLSLFNIPRIMSQEVREIKSGIGKMLIDADYVTLPFVLYDSPRSRSAVSVLETLSTKRRASSLGNVRAALRRMQIPVRYVHPEQVEDGLLMREDIRVVYMSQVVALSDTEIKELSKFVLRGGILVTDYDAGLRDEHGNARSEVAAQELFGIRYLQAGSNAKGKLRISADFEGLELKGTETNLSPSSWGANIEAGQGKPLGTINGKTPAFIVNRLGKGMTVFLNSHPGGVEQIAGESFVRKLCESLLSQARIERTFKVVDREGAFPRLRLGTFKRGGHRFIGFSADPVGYAIEDQAKVDLTVHCAEEGYLYDVRRARTLGRQSHFSLTHTPGIAEVYSLLPYEVEGIDVISVPSAAERGKTIRVKFTIRAKGEIGDHVLHVRVVDPDGKQRRAFQRNVTAFGGTVTYSLPVALNAQPGRWRVIAKDVASGMVAETEIVIR